MAAFDYQGMAEITWPDTTKTVQFICFYSGTLRVWPTDPSMEESEYLGQAQDHPAIHIKFLHYA